MTEITKTENVEIVANKDDNYVVVKCGNTCITYPLDEMKLIFRTMK